MGSDDKNNTDARERSHCDVFKYLFSLKNIIEIYLLQKRLSSQKKLNCSISLGSDDKNNIAAREKVHTMTFSKSCQAVELFFCHNNHAL